MSVRARVTEMAVEILVAEDSTTQAERLCYLLEQHGYRVTAVADGRPALTFLGQHKPALVISDINMPEMNGYELCQQIKGDEHLRDIPVILLTSLSDAADVLEGLACGADSFITKPYSEGYLMARVEQTLFETPAPSTSAPGPGVEIALPGGNRVITTDPQRMVSLLTSTYEAAIYRNTELVQTQDALHALNEHLEDLVEERTAVLTAEIAERKQRERELEAIAAISIALRSATTQAQMLPVVLEQVMALLDTSDCTLGLRDTETNELILALVHGELIGETGQRLPAGLGIGGHVLATGQPYMTANVAADRHYFSLNALNKTRAVACVPLITSSQVLGVLWAERAAAFTDVEMRVLSAIAGIAANAIQRATLHEQTEQRLQRLGALREIDSAIMNSLDLRTTLFILLGHVTAQLGVDASDILLLTRGTNVLEYAAGRGFRSKASERSRQRMGEGHAGLAALERRLVAVPDLRVDPAMFRRAALLADEAFQALFCVPLVAKGQLVGVLEVFHRAPLDPDDDWLAFLETLGGQAAIAVADAWLFSDLQQSNVEMLLAYDSTLEGWSAALDLRDHETEGHSQRVTEMTLQLAQAMGVTDGDLEQMRRGALLHDIGKMGVPDAILLKPGKLTDDEWVIMRQHPRHAYDLLSPIAYLRRALDIPYCHHEKWDGSGYPRGLRGDEIPLAARIFAVVDVWDALRSNRPYRAGWNEDAVLAYLRDEAGQHFEAKIVKAFLTLQPA